MSSLLNALKDILFYSKMFQALRSPLWYQGKKNRGANERGGKKRRKKDKKEEETEEKEEGG